MKYGVNYQYLPKGSTRPQDEGVTVDISDISDKGGFVLIPNVGDYVNLDNTMNDMASFAGKVKSRLFSYIGDYCYVNIVVEQADTDDWGALIKE